MLRKVKEMMPEGTIPVGSGLLILGLCIYVFQAFATRSFGKSHYGAFGAMWLLTFVVVPGIFLPVEQELGRALAARSARGEGAGPLIRKAAILAAGLLGITIIIVLALSPIINNVLFKHHVELLLALLFSLCSYVFAYVVRGTLAGSNRFTSYGWLLAFEGGLRAVVGAFLFAGKSHNYLAWGLLVGAAPLAGAIFALAREKNLGGEGPDASYAELSASLGWLLLGSFVAQSLLNAAPLLVQATAHTPHQHDQSSQFASSVFISRIPLFMFQAVQAALLPKLARMAASNETHAFRKGLEKMLVLVFVIGLLATLGSFTVGPFIVQKMFGADFKISHLDLGLLALGNAIFMFALASAQGLIALSALPKAAQSWAVGAIAFVITVAVVSGFYLRAELGLCVGATIAMLVMLWHVRRELAKQGDGADLNALIDVAAPYHELIEP